MPTTVLVIMESAKIRVRHGGDSMSRCPSNERVDSTSELTDIESGEIYELDDSTEEYTASGIWIPAFGVVVALSVLELLAISVAATVLVYLAAEKMLNLLSGVLWVAGTIANSNTKNKRYVHYEAVMKQDKRGIMVGPGRSKAKAITRIKNGHNCWSIGATNALSIAKAASPTGRYVLDYAHNPRKTGVRTFTHYHPYERTGAHPFFGGGKIWK